PAVAGTQHVRRADIARADRADIDADATGEQQAEGDGAEEIPQHGGDQEIHALAPSRLAAWLKTGRPATKLCMTAPCMRAPSKAVLRERERSAPSFTTQGNSGSKTMRSAGAPTPRRPESRPRISAGRLVMARSTVNSSTSPEWTRRSAA